jgi:hypothetical protein
MVRMALPKQHPVDRQQTVDLTPPVVEFGAPEPARRWKAAGLARGALRGFADDRRVVPVAAALATVAVFASLVSEWQLTGVDRGLFGGEVGTMTVPTELTDLGAFGTGYLVGVFLLAATVVLTMFGPPPGRRYARLIGLSTGGTLLGLLAATAKSLGDQSRTVSALYTGEFKITVGYGRGVWCAIAGVLLAVLALYLAGRHVPEKAVDEPIEDEGPVFSWRQPPVPQQERPADEPLELTVSPVQPFTTLAEDRLAADRDNPHGSGRPGISG